VRRFLPLLLILLAAAVPAAASAQVPAAPVATTGPAESITQTGATFTGSVDRKGGATTYHFEYGTSAAYGLTTPETAVPEGTDPVIVKVPVTGLTRDTLYHFRIVATNPGTAPAIGRGADRTFRTAPGPRPPAVTSTGSRDVNSRGARLITTVDPNALETSVRFEYGRSTRYGTSTPTVSAGAGDARVPMSIPIDGLRPYTRYHFRAVATNAAGTTRSLDRSFVTPREPTRVSIGLTPSRVVWGGKLTVIGRVGGTAVRGTPLALERQAFPFTASFSEIATRRANSDGSFRFEVPPMFVTTHFRVVTRSTVVLSSPILTASSLVKVQAGARNTSRRRARVRGTIWPQVSQGVVSLQKRSRRGRYRTVRRHAARRLDAGRSRFSFSVKRDRRGSRYRVVVSPRDGGAHLQGRSRVVTVRARRR
jgi:hypothetical protein